MSRSFRKPWIKDKPKLNYNKIIRSNINQIVKSMLIKDVEKIELPSHKTIVNDWDICDYKYESEKEKYKRK